MVGQKQAIISSIKQILPNFIPYKDIALVMLTNQQLENLKFEIGADILSRKIEYSKPLSDKAEVMAYARSMVMNHLKKARELNGNQVYGVGPAVAAVKQPKALATLNIDILPDDLKEFVKTLM